MTKMIKLGLIGFGNVGQELARILIEKEKKIGRIIYDVHFKVTAVTTRSKGSLVNETGIDLKRALADLAEAGVFSKLLTRN
jgi:homoserine dehydrogenase